MNAWTLVLSGARYYWRTHLGVLIGAALGALVLTGALLVGDSVRATLRAQALARVGRTDVAMTSGDRFFRSALADAVRPAAAPVLLLRASVARADGAARVNAAQLLGVDDRFWGLSLAGKAPALPAGGLALNQRLAEQLHAAIGDTVVIRVEKPGVFSRDAPLSGEENEVVAIRGQVARILTPAESGNFALHASQIPPFSVFLPLGLLQKKTAQLDRANLLLASFAPGWIAPSAASSLAPAGAGEPRQKFPLKPAEVRAAVVAAFSLADASLTLLDLRDGGLELRSPRVFLDPAIVDAAPPAAGAPRIAALTYFVNELRTGDHATPYSMVTAVSPGAGGPIPEDLKDDEVVITQWLADDLGAGVGSQVTIKYYVIAERRQLLEKEHHFTIRAILPMDAPHVDGSWMPDFPGLADKQNCRDWKPGFQFDSSRMRDRDQAYWEKYRGTPKAFVNLKVGQELWSNRWGEVTALRWPLGTPRAEVEQGLLAKLTPDMLGFQFQPLRELALAATDAPVDFGELFVYFSFFLIIAAAVLTGMLFVFSLEQRNAEAGLLLALGLRPHQVRRLFLAEGAVLALVGSLLGAVGGIIYTKLVLHALTTVWRGAVGSVDFLFVVPPGTLLIGIFSGVAVALVAMWLASRRQLRQGPRALLQGEAVESPRRVGKPFLILLLAAVAFLTAGLLPWMARGAGAFFGAGALLLISGLLGQLAWLRRLARAVTPGLESIAQLGARNTARRRGRSLATIAVLASGVFMVVAVDSFRHPPLREGDTSDPGTGGFALVGESSLPIYEDLNSPKGRETYGLSDAIMHDVKVVPLRVRDGDEASCLNLNLALQPRILGVKPQDLADRKAFAFASDDSDWTLLAKHPAETEIAGIADENTLEYSVKKSVGDTIAYRDDRGQSLPVRIVAGLVGSILQGNVLIAEDEFVRRFPGSGGYRYFLIDCPPDRTAAVRAELSRALTDRGLELSTTAHRLGEFQAVENTYLAIFQALGGLGLLLGSAGLAVVVARNVLERRREFGLLAAVGFRPRQLRQLVFVEHRGLIVAALVIGTASALLGVWPNLIRQAGGFPLREISLLLAILALGCLFWTWLATLLALRAGGVKTLRAE